MRFHSRWLCFLCTKVERRCVLQLASYLSWFLRNESDCSFFFLFFFFVSNILMHFFFLLWDLHIVKRVLEMIAMPPSPQVCLLKSVSWPTVQIHWTIVTVKAEGRRWRRTRRGGAVLRVCACVHSSGDDDHRVSALLTYDAWSLFSCSTSCRGCDRNHWLLHAVFLGWLFSN